MTPSAGAFRNKTGRVLAVQKISSDPGIPFVNGHIYSNNTWLVWIMDDSSMIHGWSKRCDLEKHKLRCLLQVPPLPPPLQAKPFTCQDSQDSTATHSSHHLISMNLHGSLLGNRVSRGASMSSNSTVLPALGVTIADWIGKSCMDGIFSLAQNIHGQTVHDFLTNAWLWMIFIQETSTEESWAPVYVDAFQILTYSTYLTCGPCPRAVHSQGLMMWLSSLTIGEKPL